MKKYLPLIALSLSLEASAQIPEDVLKYSFYAPTGSARSQAIGGAMASLGGDISSIFINPAGLGNYRTSEVVFSPALVFHNNSANYRGTTTSGKRSGFDLGTSGVVMGYTDARNHKRSSAFGIGITQLANYNNTITYKGLNNYSSFSEQWAEELSNSGLTIDEALNNASFAYGTAPALYTYLVDTFRVNGNLMVKSLPEFLLDNGSALMQEKTTRTSGGLYELALAFAENHNDKWQWGATVGIPIMSYSNTTTFTERDTSSATNNNFGYFTYTDQYSTHGAGLNLKGGVIYRPQEYLRFGLAIHTPSYLFSVKDKRTTDLSTDTENYNSTASVSSKTFTNGVPGESKYAVLTPWKVMLSGSYVFREVADVRKQKAFITADVEYVGQNSSGFHSANEDPTADETAYYKALNRVIRGEYKGNFNFRLGGELKFNVIMFRMGGAYTSNPYKDPALKANRWQLSGGLGYRDKGFFVDLTYVHSWLKDVDFGYRLQDRDNTFASIKTQRGHVALTVGIKF